jgi:hypothetical protein
VDKRFLAQFFHCLAVPLSIVGTCIPKLGIFDPAFVKSVRMRKTIAINLAFILLYYVFLQLLVWLPF